MTDKIFVKSFENKIRAQVGGFIKGDKGDVGPIGPVGPRGPMGPEGPKGEQGIKGQDGTDGVDGKDGRGIASISLSKTDGKDKTYTVTYTDGTTFEFTVKDGEDGKDGTDGKGMSGGAILKGAEKTSRKTNDYNAQGTDSYPSSKALSDAVVYLSNTIEKETAFTIYRGE